MASQKYHLQTFNSITGIFALIFLERAKTLCTRDLPIILGNFLGIFGESEKFFSISFKREYLFIIENRLNSLLIFLNQYKFLAVF